MDTSNNLGLLLFSCLSFQVLWVELSLVGPSGGVVAHVFFYCSICLIKKRSKSLVDLSKKTSHACIDVDLICHFFSHNVHIAVANC